MKISPILGCGIGDGLGVPFEMKSPKYKPLMEWDGLFKDGGTFRKYNKAGQYSDDTIATICLAESLIECNGFDPENAANKYLAWFNSGEFRGMGSTTSHALWRLKTGASWKESGLVGDEFGGNGTIMRASPIAIFYHNNLEKLVEAAILDASITHNSKEPKMGSVAGAVGIASLYNNSEDKKQSSKEYALNDAISILSELGNSVVLQKLKLTKELLSSDIKPEDALLKIGASGYVPETAGAAFYCMCKTNSFKEAVIMAVKAGQDADTTGAVVGAMAGTYYGFGGIPEEYYSVENFEMLKALDEKLYTASNPIKEI